MSPFNGFEDQSVLGNDEFRCLRQRSTEVLELFDGEAFVFDSGEEVAVCELLFDGFNSFFLFCAADGGPDCGGWWWFAVMEFEFGGGDGEGVNEVGF